MEKLQNVEGCPVFGYPARLSTSYIYINLRSFCTKGWRNLTLGFVLLTGFIATSIFSFFEIYNFDSTTKNRTLLLASLLGKLVFQEYDAKKKVMDDLSKKNPG